MIDTLLDELARFGDENDRTQTARARRMLNITPDTGAFLDVLVRATGARRVLEIGTSNGYSTLWLARAAQAGGGRVTSVEMAADKFAMATANLARAGLDGAVTLIHADAGAVLAESAYAAWDFIFLDSERSSYARWWPQLARVLAPRGLLVVDNAISHAEEMTAFIAQVEASAGFSTALAPVGKGEFMAVKGDADCTPPRD